ncbi:MAG: hypothetical protein P0S96_01480 [Simkaniaceae bacterium]|nr:hypothetical protein [Candidatus Sacchlamyda saccharinae]
MRIYDSDSDKKINRVILYLTLDEAKEMKDSLEAIIKNTAQHHHEHIPDRNDDFKREISVCVYNKDNLSSFDERSQKLIILDE